MKLFLGLISINFILTHLYLMYFRYRFPKFQKWSFKLCIADYYCISEIQNMLLGGPPKKLALIIFLTYTASKRIGLESSCWSGFEALKIFFKSWATGKGDGWFVLLGGEFGRLCYNQPAATYFFTLRRFCNHCTAAKPPQLIGVSQRGSIRCSIIISKYKIVKSFEFISR